jgi:two-component system alkaline phosphatase synthesis response regulator PhoP
VKLQGKAMHTKIVVIDDDRFFRRSAQRFLESHLDEVFVISCDSAEEGERLIGVHRPHIVILDLKLPGIDGMELLERMPHGPSDPDVIVVSGQPATDAQTEETYIEALGLGAHHFHRKGDGQARMLAQVKRLIAERQAVRQERTVENEIVEVPELDLVLYRDDNLATNRGQEVNLTPVEGRYLGLLMENCNRVVPLELFYSVLCESEGESSQLFDQTNKQTIRAHICYLRKKLGQNTDSESLIQTVRTKGYKLVVPQEQPEVAVA